MAPANKSSGCGQGVTVNDSACADVFFGVVFGVGFNIEEDVGGVESDIGPVEPVDTTESSEVELVPLSLRSRCRLFWNQIWICRGETCRF